MRIGACLSGDIPDPAAWIAELRRSNHSAAYCPVDEKADAATVRAYADAAAAANVLIAEVGAWSNPISANAATRKAAIALCQSRLDLADRIGATCCVNSTGSRGTKWDGPFPADLTEETFALVVESVREIVDGVKPRRAFYVLETMPWMYPDSPDSYIRLLRAIDRPSVAVHLDLANLINSIDRYFNNAAFLRECFAKLGPRIKSCHAKDVLLRDHLTLHLDEVRPGQGGLDYRAFLCEVDRLGPDIPVMLEHLPSQAEYTAGVSHLRMLAGELGLEVK